MVGLQMERMELGIERSFSELLRLSRQKKPKKVITVEEFRGLDVTLELREKLDLYIQDIEKFTSRKMTAKQRALLENYVSTNRIYRADKNSEKRLRGEYHRKKRSLREEWELQTGQKWPTYEEDIYNDKGTIIRNKGQFYDAHHIIELSYSGVNQWWNIFPAKHPDEHQQGIHSKDSIASNIFIETFEVIRLEVEPEIKIEENNEEKKKDKKVTNRKKRKLRLKK